MRRLLLLGFVALIPLLAACDDDPAPEDGVDLTGDGVGSAVMAGLGDEGEVALADLRGRPVVVNFFASTCAPCVREMPALEADHQRYGDDVAFVGIAVADRVEDALELVEQTGVTYSLATDPSGEVFASSGSSLLPSTIVLDADGEVVARLTGELEGDELAVALAEAGVEAPA